MLNSANSVCAAGWVAQCPMSGYHRLGSMSHLLARNSKTDKASLLIIYTSFCIPMSQMRNCKNIDYAV